MFLCFVLDESLCTTRMLLSFPWNDTSPIDISVETYFLIAVAEMPVNVRTLFTDQLSIVEDFPMCSLRKTARATAFCSSGLPLMSYVSLFLNCIVVKYKSQH